MLDMSKAFDTVNRMKLFEGLKQVLLPEELHILHILINDVFIKVRVGNEMSDEIKTEIGIMQGDCLSAILFIFYLSMALTPEERSDHSYHIENFASVKWKSYIKEENLFTISPKYADDTTWASTDVKVIDMIKETVPNMLRKADLIVNDSKTEEFAIPVPPRDEILKEHNYTKHPAKEEWKKCKLLGSYLDTEQDIKHRRALVMTHMKSHRKIFKSKHLSLDLKIRYFNCFITSIFLYNCALWTLTSSMSKRIDSFHRRMLRIAIGIYYPKKISNTDLYHLTGQCQWSNTITQRRKRLLGHICRLDPNTPARQALDECLKENTRKIGRPKLTWIDQIKRDLAEINIYPDSNFDNIIKLAENRDSWRNDIVNTSSHTLHNSGQPLAMVHLQKEGSAQV